MHATIAMHVCRCCINDSAWLMCMLAWWSIDECSVSQQTAKIREFEGWTCLVNPARRLCELEYKKCDSDGLAFNVFITPHLTNSFCKYKIVFILSSPRSKGVLGGLLRLNDCCHINLQGDPVEIRIFVHSSLRWSHLCIGLPRRLGTETYSL